MTDVGCSQGLYREDVIGGVLSPTAPSSGFEGGFCFSLSSQPPAELKFRGRRGLLPMLILAGKRARFLLLVLTFSGCGYHVAGRSDALPQTIHVIAVPALENTTTSYRIEQRFTSATVHEFLAKTHYKVVSNAADGDAVLKGKIVGLEAVPLLFDTVSGRATTMLVTVKCEVSLTQTATDKVLYHADNFIFRSEYEISTDIASFFEEQDPALDRLARDFANRLVAAVTENY